MTSGQDPIEKHPVLVREVLRGDGSRVLSLRVYCSRQSASVDLETCEVCASCIDISPDPGGTQVFVRCEPVQETANARAGAPEEGSGPGGLAGGTTPVGEILSDNTLCVGTDTHVPAIIELMKERSLPGVFVVDDEGHLVGIVRDVNLLRTLEPMPHMRQEPLHALAGSHVETVMSTAMAIGEDSPVRRALLCMAHAHLREIPVVTREGRLVGVLRDIEGLRWFASERRAKP